MFYLVHHVNVVLNTYMMQSSREIFQKYDGTTMNDNKLKEISEVRELLKYGTY
jgi:hypothetical protein